MTSQPAAVPHSKSGTAGRRRTVVALGAVCAGLLSLSACDKPTPLATVTVGDDSVHSEAACYNDGKRLTSEDARKCLKDTSMKTIKVDPDATVRFGVDPEIADKGWTILLNNNPLTDASKKTYRQIPASVFFSQQYGASGGSTTVSVVEGSSNETTGLWSFKFVQDS